jgi:hypothetical protein
MTSPESTREKFAKLIRDQSTTMDLIQHVSHPTNGIRKKYYTQCVAIIRALDQLLTTFFRLSTFIYTEKSSLLEFSS